MQVMIGNVETFPDVKLSKAQALKPLEEAAEVFGAFQYLSDLLHTKSGDGPYETASDEDIAQARQDLIDECCDTIQATANLLAAIGIKDAVKPMFQCLQRNRARGRL